MGRSDYSRVRSSSMKANIRGPSQGRLDQANHIGSDLLVPAAGTFQHRGMVLAACGYVMLDASMSAHVAGACIKLLRYNTAR